jgi:hypothetical protein
MFPIFAIQNGNCKYFLMWIDPEVGHSVVPSSSFAQLLHAAWASNHPDTEEELQSDAPMKPIHLSRS